MKVRALKQCFDGQALHEVGDIFEWPHQLESYMEKVDDEEEVSAASTELGVSGKKSKASPPKAEQKQKTGGGDVI